MSKNSEIKAKFRATKEWKDFRIQKLTETDNKCDCCGGHYPGKKSRGLHIHHRKLDIKDYSDISNPDHFRVLCKSCHDAQHFFHNRVIAKKNPTTNQALIDFQSPYFL
jgi:hypothetical protein